MKSLSLCSAVVAVMANLLGVCAASRGEDAADEIRQRVDGLFADVSATADPGCAVGIMRDGRTIYSRGFGSANVAYAAPNRPTTAFEIASGSKSFTSACVALLMDQGKVKPEDDVRQFVPELQLNKAVRIRDMLRCESGIWAQFHIMPLAGWDNVPFHAPFSKEDVLTVLSGQRHLPFEPGSQFQYGSGDMFLLGIVVERVSGKSLARFAKENLFEPLGMTRTWYLEDPGLAVENRAVGHWKSDAGWTSGRHSPATEWRQWRANANLGGGAGVVTCVEDLLRWSRIYQDQRLPRGTYVDEFTKHGTVVGNAFVLDIDAYVKHVNQHPDNPPAGEYRGVKRIQITGGYWGFSACMSHFPELDTTIVCLSNSDQISAIGKARRIAEIVLSDALHELPIAASAARDADFVELDQTELNAFAASYRREGNHPIWTLTNAGDGLLLDDGFGGLINLKPISATRFKPHGDSPFDASAIFEFKSAAAGTTGLTLSWFDNGVHQIIGFRRLSERAADGIDALRDFEGTYISPELASIYRIRFADGVLQLRVGSRRWEPLKPVEEDEFSPIVKDPHNTRFLRFTRDGAGRVDGFSIGFWRIHGVRFERLDAEH